jgi:hypothetical protein
MEENNGEDDTKRGGQGDTAPDNEESKSDQDREVEAKMTLLGEIGWNEFCRRFRE